ncbi:AAA family ATPase [Bradyrhizobium sp. Pha-3]|uniref:ATP-binding protein n=1 Tax=Bradyrhizobium sp. Pha-3 TaxID=208375 RepID=UPI0035D42C99
MKIECTACGYANEPNNRYCGQCSAVLSVISPDTSQSPQQLLKSLSIKGGERKTLTVLFADIQNSTGLIDSLGDPELGMRRLDPVIALMKDAVHKYDGVVNKTQGDGIMALFGAPRPHEDHAVRACLAALSMLDAIAKLNDPDIHVRAGVNTGEVVVQAVENSMHQSYDAAGAAVHLANRLEQMADADCVLVADDTFRAAKQFVEGNSLGPRAIRGLKSPIEVHQLLGLRNAPASGVFRTGRLNRLVGRDDQAAFLRRELVEAANGDGRVVGVVGEAGIGKSRLCFEFAEDCRRKDIRVFEARVLAHGRATPFQPVLELLRDFFGIKPDDAADIARSRVRERFTAVSDSELLLRHLLEFLGIAETRAAPSKVDPKGRKLQLLDFVRTLVRSGPRNVPTVVIIEDLHWIDAASEEFVEALADAVVGTSLLLIVNFRPGFAAPLMQKSHYKQINMPPLALNQAQMLLRECCGDDASLALVGRNIVERAQGNPFFLEELVNAIAERGDFEGERGAYRLKGGLESIPLPATVQAVVAARIDRLETSAKNVLEVASVFGREFELPILSRVAGIPSEELAEAMWQLRQAELVYDLPPYERGVHAFRHPLIQDVTYKSLLRERSKSIHAAVADAIQTSKDFKEERAALLAYHFEQAGEALKAAQLNMRAAIWAGSNDPSQALRSWKKVRELLANQPASQSNDYLRMMACGQIVNHSWREGISAEDAWAYYDEAKKLAFALGDVRANALINAAYGRILANGGSADEYVERIREAAAIAEPGPDESVKVTLKAVLCHALRLSGKMLQALELNVEALNRAHEIVKFDRQTLGFDINTWLIAMRGQTLVMLGRGDEARPYLEDVMKESEETIDPIHSAIPSLAYVDLAWSEGDNSTAQLHAARAFSLAAKSGNPYLRVYAQASRGLAHLVSGNYSAAIDEMTNALRFARSRKAGLENEARILADLANAYSLRGDRISARSFADEAIAVASSRHTRIPACLAHIVRAEIVGAGSEQQSAEAESDLSRAAQLIEETGAAIYQPLLDRVRQRIQADEPTRSSQAS